MAEETTIIPLPLLNPVPDAAFIYAVHNSVDYKAKREDFVNQNNLDLFVNIYTNISLSSQAQLSYINTQTFVVGETQTLWMRIIQFEVIAGFDEIRVVALYKHILGKGTYGNTGTAISYSNLEFITTYIPTAADYQNAPTTETVVIEDLEGLDVSQFVNAKNPFYVVKAISEGRTLFATPSGIYLFKLAGGNYGINGITTTTLADYELLSETATIPTIDAEVIENSTNAVSGGGVYGFVQPILEKEVPIITDSFTILDSADSKRKKLTFDNLINYVKVFFDQSLALFKTANFLDATSSIQTQINSALNRTLAQIVQDNPVISNSARIYWINGLFNSSINQESLDFTFYNQPNNQYRFLRMNSGGISTRKVYNGDSYGFEFPEGIGVGAFQPEITAGLPITIQKFKTYINIVNTVYNPAFVLTDNFEFTIRVIAGTATFSSTSFVFYPGDNVILRYFSGVWTVFNINNPTLNFLPKKGASGFVDSLIFDNGTNVGINQLTPTEKLDVIGNGKFSGTIYANRFDAVSSNARIFIENSGGGNYGLNIHSNSADGFAAIAIKGGVNVSQSEFMLFGQYDDGKMFFFNQGANPIGFFTSGNEKMSISAIGNVGIGTTTPTEKLDVNGSIKLSNLLKLGQFTTATEPAYVKGVSFFNTTLNKMRVGGATAYETVTSS
jgi:hypothetical protein